jgi:hypothetical protein
LVLLGRAGAASPWEGRGEARRDSCERLRDGTGGGGRRSVALQKEEEEEEQDEEEPEEEGWRPCREESGAVWTEKEEGRVPEEDRWPGAEGGERREVPLVRERVLVQEEEEEEEEEKEEEEERRLDVSVSKGSGFHCASPWMPLSPLGCGVREETMRGLATVHTGVYEVNVLKVTQTTSL